MRQKCLFGVLFVSLIFICVRATPESAVTLTFPNSGSYSTCNFTFLSADDTNSTSIIVGNNNWICININDHTFHSCTCTSIEITQLVLEILVQTVEQGAESILETVGGFLRSMFG